MKEMIKTSARKGKGIDEIFANLPVSADALIIRPAVDNALNQVINKLAAAFQKWDYTFVDEYKESITEVLTPSQIGIFLTAIRIYEDFSDFSEIADLTLRNLLRNSYNAGFNDFHLGSVEEFFSACSSLKGTAKRPIKLTVKDAGNWFFSNCEYAECTVEKVGRNSARSLSHSRLHIKETVQGDIGTLAQNCFFHLEKVHDFVNLGASGCTFFINQMTGDCKKMSQPMGKYQVALDIKLGRSPPCEPNTYKTTSLDTLALILKYVPERNLVLFDERVVWKYAPKKNLIYFIHPNGREVLVE